MTRQWNTRRVLILGAGPSGFSASDTLVERGSTILVLAREVDEELLPLFRVIGADPVLVSDDEMLKQAIEFDPDLVVVSPSFAPTHPVIDHFVHNRQIRIISEIELAWQIRNPDGAEWITLAGDAASHVAALTERFLRIAGIRTIRLGFGSASVLDGVRLPEQPHVFLVVLTPQQLHYQSEVVPLVSAFLNPDTSESWHEDIAQRITEQGKVYENTRNFAIYNRSNEFAELLLQNADVQEGCRAIGFWLASPGPGDIGVVEDLVVDRGYHDDRRNTALELASLAELRRAGFETAEDFEVFLAASAIARAVGVTPEQITQVLQSLSENWE